MKKILLLFVIATSILLSNAQKFYPMNMSQILDPIIIKPFMFTKEITGEVDVLTPFKQQKNLKGQIIRESYVIQMVQTKQQFLPEKIFQATPIYAYGGLTQNGFKSGFPGPAIIAKKDVAVRVTWRTHIQGPHILPVDTSHPFRSSSQFVQQVPVIPHVHGVATDDGSDGLPEAYWTQAGTRAQFYRTVQPCPSNQAIFQYPNEQEAGNHWYHDHTIGITRLNVYAGLAGLYKIVDPNCNQHQKQKYLMNKYGKSINQNATKFLIVADKTFKPNGQLYVPSTAPNSDFTSWNPQFYGTMMLVNGVIWPKMTLKKGVYRFVLLNACQSRYLNIWFENNKNKLPFQLVRVDGDYYKNQVVVTEFFVSLANRVQFILDLTKVSGQVILKNNADAPYPMGDPSNLVPQFTGQIMKIIVENNLLLINNNPQAVNPSYVAPPVAVKYPAFPEGEKVFTTLIELQNENGDPAAMYIDGISMMTGMDCKNSTYKIGKVYDFYFINLTPDTHPIHFHLINMQKVKQFPFNVSAYEDKYYNINGGKPSKFGFGAPPLWLDPEQFRTGADEFPKQYQKVFKDTIDTAPGYVTVMRVKFSKNNGQDFKSFQLKKQRYVLHCHILPHQDNEMMKYFCLQ